MADPEITKESYTINEFCHCYSVGRSTVYKEMTSGRLPARKIGKRTIILKSDADKWLANLPISRWGGYPNNKEKK